MRNMVMFFMAIALILYTFAPDFFRNFQEQFTKNFYIHANPDNKTNAVNNDTQTEGSENIHDAQYLYTVDGDTIAVMFEGKEERVRFLMMNTPETKVVKVPEPYGPEASAFTENFFNGAQTIQLEFDVQKRDPHGRLLAYVYLNGVMVNEELLKQGLAEVTIYEPNKKYEERFYNVQNEAIKQKLGLWSNN